MLINAYTRIDNLHTNIHTRICETWIYTVVWYEYTHGGIFLYTSFRPRRFDFSFHGLRRPKPKDKIKIKIQSRWARDWKLHMYLSCVAVCANGWEVVFHRRILKCQWEEMFENLSDRLMAVCSVSELFIDPVQILDLDTPIHVCQLFGCYNVRFSVLNDQNAASSRTYWIHSFALRKLGNEFVISPPQNYIHFFLYLLPPPHTDALSGIRETT